ncbi:hypothetical protein V1527DRAFT_457923 [Lipomyces starkeyi]
MSAKYYAAELRTRSIWAMTALELRVTKLGLLILSCLLIGTGRAQNRLASLVRRRLSRVAHDPCQLRSHCTVGTWAFSSQDRQYGHCGKFCLYFYLDSDSIL